jgi:hypothetical protein
MRQRLAGAPAEAKPGGGEPDAPAAALTVRTREGRERPRRGGADGEPRPRRISTTKAAPPEQEAEALLRYRYLHHLVSQVKLSCVVRGRTGQRLRRQHVRRGA